MRIASSLVIATALIMSGAAIAEPLAPGKPAGVHAAQMTNTEWLVFGGVGVLAAAVLIANNGSGSHAAVASQPISVVTTSATTT